MTSILQASGGAQLPYLWSPSVVHAEGKGKSYLDDFGSHPGMEKRSYAPGSWEAEAGSQDRAAHTDASRWGSASLWHVIGWAGSRRLPSDRQRCWRHPSDGHPIPFICLVFCLRGGPCLWACEAFRGLWIPPLFTLFRGCQPLFSVPAIYETSF